jgi:hypothetical protein
MCAIVNIFSPTILRFHILHWDSAPYMTRVDRYYTIITGSSSRNDEAQSPKPAACVGLFQRHERNRHLGNDNEILNMN